MNKQRKTSHILNVFQYDADGHVVLPASLALGIAPTGEDNSGKVPTTAWVRSIVGGAVTAYAPTSRTITINGTSYDLSANRAWSIDTGVMTASAGLGISVSVVNQNLNIVNTGILTASSGAGISLSVVNQNLNVVNTGILTASAGLGISLSVVNQNLNVINTGILTASAGSGISLSVVGQNLNVINTGVLTASAGAGISLSIVGGNLNVVNTITNNNQLTNGAGYITSSALTGYATETYVGTAISNLVDAAPGTLDTLNELAAALGDDPNFATTVSTSIGTKVPQARTITINGTSYDLTANRSWTINSMVYPSAGIALSTGTAWGTSITDNSANWNTAYGWGNHASGGYLTTASAASTYVSLTGSYANPSWITSLAYSKITGVPAFLTSYTETDTLATVTARGGSTTAGITVNGRVTAVGSGTYAVTGSSTQRYIMQALNTSNSVNAAYGWWWFHNTNGDMGFHADAVGDILTLTRAGGATVNGNAILTAGNYTSYTYSTTDADGRFLRGTTNPGSVNNFTISIGNNGSYSYVQSHSGQPLELNPVGNVVRIAGNVVWHQGNLTNLNQLSNGPGYITSYTETDTLASVTGRGSTTSATLTSTNGLGLYVNSGAASYIGINSTSNWSYVSHLNNGTTRWDVGAFNGGQYEFRPYGGDSNRVTIQLNGQFSVNNSQNQVALFQSGNANTWVDIISATRTWSMGSTSGSTWAIYDRNSNATRMEIDTGSNLYAYGSMRSPIFYDSQDAGYYLDPNDYSRLNKLVLNQSRVNSSRYPIGHYTPGETVFEIDPTWSNDQLQAYFASSSVAWTNDSGAPGGYAIRIDGSVNVGGSYSSGFPYIPVDQDDIFYMECWIKSVSGTITHYMGSIDYDSGFSSLGGNPGSFGYWTMSNTSTSTSWQKVAGYITGFGGSTGQFVNGTKYWTPQALFNYGQISGNSCVISGWKVIRVGHAGNRTFRNNINVLGQVSIGTTNTRLTSNNYNGYVEFRSSSSNYLGVGVISNNGWGYIESVNNSNGLYLYTVAGGRYAFDNGDVTPYNDAENSLGNGSYRWAQVYTSGWLRQYGAQGMYNQDYGTHFYSGGSSSWSITGSGGNVELVFRSNHQSTVRGYVYADTSNNIGFLNNSGGWSLRMTSGGDAYVSGYLYVNGAGTSSSIFMQDSDEGQREIHCNSNRIGFLNQSGSWGSWCDDSGNWVTGAGVYASVFYDYDNGGYYLDPNSMSNLYSIQMPHLGNGTSNLVVNNGGSENWGAIRIEGGSGNLRIGKSDAGRSWSGRVSLAMHVGASESFRVHSDGWTSLFEVWGASGYARLRESLEIGGDLYLGTRNSWLTTLLDAKQNSSSAINSSFRNVIEDTRGGQRSPNDYDDYRVSYEFTNQMPHDGNWQSVMTLQGWHNGYAAWQIQGPATSAAYETWYLRSGINGSWNTARTIIHSGNIGSQTVSNSAQLDGYGRSNFLGLNGNSYFQANTWIQLNGWHGLYAPSWNGAHWMPNNASTYTTWRIAGSRSGYSGIYDDYSAVNMLMFDSAGNGGAYRENNGRWYWYHHLGNNCTAIATSTTSSSYRAYIGGSLYAEGDVVAYSDVRKKTDITTIDNALEKVNKLRGVFYTRIDAPERGRQTGVIAQEINQVLPEVVTYAADVDEYGVSYGNITGVLIEAIKEQQKQIEELQNKLDNVLSSR
jgi:hypothetical protein